MQRFFIPQPTGYQVGQSIDFPDKQAHQVQNVLRMGVGTRVWVLDNAGGLYEVALTAVSRRQVSGKVCSKQQSQSEPQLKLTLFQSLTKRDKFEWILQKGTELGVHSFVPIVTQRSLVQDVKIKPGKLARWQKIVTEAAEQSHRGMIPVVASPQLFTKALTQTQRFDRSLIASVAENKDSLPSFFDRSQTLQTVALFIGPEGGFTTEEVENGRSHGMDAFSLGNRVLRTETAALVASTLILYEMGELV